MNFGVARATDADVLLTTQHTHVGDIIGTIRYMSPEQCDGDPAKIDTRSDVYALGVVLYELLTGVSPYETANTTPYVAMRAIKESPPRTPSVLNPSLRGDLEAILLKALSKQTAQRYGSAADLGRDIRRHLSGEPIEARRPGRAARVARWAIRSPWRAAGVFGGAMILAVCLATGWITNVLVESRTREFLMSYPASVLYDVRSHSARVLTRAGHVMREWTHVVAPRWDKPVLRPDALGGGHMFFVAHSTEAESESAGALRAYDFDRPHDPPLWTVRMEKHDLPKYCLIDREYSEHMFNADVLLAAEIFPESPGHEIVVCHKHNVNSQCMLAIYDQRGARRFSVWHDGGFTEAYWLVDEGILVLQGLNSIAKWEHRDCDECRALKSESGNARIADPMVIVGIRPKFNTFMNDWLAPNPDMDEPKPEWYKCLWPPTLRAHGLSIVRLGHPRFMKLGLGVAVSIQPSNEESLHGITFELDGRGELYRPSFRPSDLYSLPGVRENPTLAVELRPLPRVTGFPVEPRVTPLELTSFRP